MTANIWLTWGDVFNASLQNLWWGFIQFAPKLILAIIFFAIGWLLGNIIARALEQVFSALKIDNLLKSTEDFLKRMKELREQIEKKSQEATIERVY